ncbi:hypothetical protein EBB_05175 [Methylomonas sp. EbB]|uniref:Calcium-binding protein n=2 Tax=Methylomonas fluvii TaxID=1854564 RepID=A0ABR9D9Z1_9GAMM|nr:hypothetical protein [Methylomonas fluvii]
MGGGDDVVDLTSRRYGYGDIKVDGGSGKDIIWASAGNDLLLGGGGDDRIDGGAGYDVLQGGTGNDQLSGGFGNDLLQGGYGNDSLRDINGHNLMDGGAGDDDLSVYGNAAVVIGGIGNDELELSGGSNVILFNRGDRSDTLDSTGVRDDTLSLGGGIRYSDLKFRKNGGDLVLDMGNGDRIKFEDWYDGAGHKTVLNLQVVTEAMTGFDQNSANPLMDNKIETFDFTGLVNSFDAARASRPGLSSWALSNALSQFHLGGSDTEAFGGDLAYQYGKNGSLSGISTSAAQETIAAPGLGTQTQTLHSLSSLQEGMTKLV